MYCLQGHPQAPNALSDTAHHRVHPISLCFSPTRYVIGLCGTQCSPLSTFHSNEILQKQYPCPEQPGGDTSSHHLACDATPESPLPVNDIMVQHSDYEQQKEICTGSAAAREPNTLPCPLSSAPRLLWPSVSALP